jgi:organic radical activating enzyme
MAQLEGVQKDDDVIINGGEPGMVKRQTMIAIMSKLEELQCNIEVNTNGMFFKTFPEYYPIVSHFNYHCSEMLLTDIEDLSKVNDDKVSYTLVITDESYPRLGEYLNKYPDITFKIYAATQPYSILPNRTSLSKKNALRIVKEYRDILDRSALDKLFHHGCDGGSDGGY